MSVTPVGPFPTNLVCPSCQAAIVTRVKNKPSTKTHIISLILCLFFWVFCLCLVPYFLDSCMDADHFCPDCGAYIGTYQR